MIDIDIKEERHVNVDVHRAPTDESVKLLREMEAKAEAAITFRTKVSDTHFECVVQQWRDNLNDSVKTRAVFSLNGKKLTADVETQRRQLDDRTEFHRLRDEIAKTIATEVLNDAYVAMMKGPR